MCTSTTARMRRTSYETAPEKKTLTEAKPVAGNYFSCIAQMPDDSQYYYMISSDGSDTLSVKIKKAANKGGEKIPEDAMWCDYGYSDAGIGKGQRDRPLQHALRTEVLAEEWVPHANVVHQKRRQQNDHHQQNGVFEIGQITC